MKEVNTQILIIDLGSQYTQIIRRSLRYLGFHSIVISPGEALKWAKEHKPKAIILSGGDSSRMGSPKALLTYVGKTFLEHCVDALSHVSIIKILVVTGSAREEINKYVNELSLPVTLIRNPPHPAEGQYSLLQTALTSISFWTSSRS